MGVQHRLLNDIKPLLYLNWGSNKWLLGNSSQGSLVWKSMESWQKRGEVRRESCRIKLPNLKSSIPGSAYLWSRRRVTRWTLWSRTRATWWPYLMSSDDISTPSRTASFLKCSSSGNSTRNWATNAGGNRSRSDSASSKPSSNRSKRWHSFLPRSWTIYWSMRMERLSSASIRQRALPNFWSKVVQNRWQMPVAIMTKLKIRKLSNQWVILSAHWPST